MYPSSRKFYKFSINSPSFSINSGLRKIFKFLEKFSRLRKFSSFSKNFQDCENFQVSRKIFKISKFFADLSRKFTLIEKIQNLSKLYNLESYPKSKYFSFLYKREKTEYPSVSTKGADSWGLRNSLEDCETVAVFWLW